MNAPVPSIIALQWAPLSFAQQRLWFFSRLESGSSAYNIGGLLRFDGALDLDSLRLTRHISSRCAHFGLIPGMVASSLLVMTSGRLFCERFSERLSLAILPCPVEFPPLVYYQLWHARSHAGAATRWLREVVRNVALTLRNQ